MILGALLLLWLHGSACAQADELWAVVGPDLLINFSASNPSICGERRITGLFPGESIVGIDFRPGSPPLLYALANTGQLFVIEDPGSGFTIPVRPGPLPDLIGNAFGIDFDPIEDRLRVVSDAEQNLRLNPDTGEATDEGALAYAPGDPNAGQVPRITAAAYTNRFEGASSTTLYVIDSYLGVLGVLDPKGGTITTVGSLGVHVLPQNGFDISATGIAYAALLTEPFYNAHLCTIDLATGKATLLDEMCGGQALNCFAVATITASVEPSTWGHIKAQFAR